MMFKLENAIFLFHYHQEDDIKKENATILKDGYFFIFDIIFNFSRNTKPWVHVRIWMTNIPYG